MSKQIYCDKGVRYAVQCREIGNRELSLSLTDGIRVWYNEGSISYASRPSSHSRDTEEQYISYLKDALQVQSSSLLEEFVFEITVNTFNEQILQLSIKERVKGTSAYSILFRGEFRKSREGEEAVLDLISSLGAMIQDKDKEIQRLKDQEKEYLSLIDKFRADTRNFLHWRDDVQDKQVRGFCMVLNSLKREYASALQRIDELEQHAAAYGFVDTDTAQLPPSSTSSKIKKTAPTSKPKASKASKNPSSTDSMKNKMKAKRYIAHVDDVFIEEEENCNEDGNINSHHEDDDESVARSEPFEPIDLASDNIFAQKISVRGGGFLVSQNLEVDGGDITKLLQSQQQQQLSQPLSSLNTSSSNHRRANQVSQLPSQSGLKRGAEEVGVSQLRSTQSEQKKRKKRGAKAFLENSDDEEEDAKKEITTSLDFM